MINDKGMGGSTKVRNFMNPGQGVLVSRRGDIGR